MKNLIIGIAMMFGLCACAQSKYKVIAPVQLEEGEVVYLTNYDTGERLDSAVVAEHSVTFTGEVDEPFVARLIAPNGSRLATFIVEQGTSAINPNSRRAVGTMLNDAYNAIVDSLQSISGNYQTAATDEEKEAVYSQYLQYLKQSAQDNMDSPIGYSLAIEYASMISPEEMTEFFQQNPSLMEYKRIQGLMESANHKLATSEGKPFQDFEIEYNGKIEKLSDYVGRGKYCLVDFWASWCGPCMREIPVIKEIYNEYHDKGLEVLGVAVWDEPENTLAAIKRADIPWPVILNAQSIPTDIYGIPGIPCIILFGPDGIIVSRDARGDELKAVVAQAMDN